MLVFFATWCPHCNNEAPTISELESQYDALWVVMVGASLLQCGHQVAKNTSMVAGTLPSPTEGLRHPLPSWQ